MDTGLSQLDTGLTTRTSPSAQLPRSRWRWRLLEPAWRNPGLPPHKTAPSGSAPCEASGETGKITEKVSGCPWLSWAGPGVGLDGPRGSLNLGYFMMFYFMLFYFMMFYLWFYGWSLQETSSCQGLRGPTPSGHLGKVSRGLNFGERLSQHPRAWRGALVSCDPKTRIPKHRSEPLQGWCSIPAHSRGIQPGCSRFEGVLLHPMA